jgi:hypothetical protein
MTSKGKGTMKIYHTWRNISISSDASCDAQEDVN